MNNQWRRTWQALKESLALSISASTPPHLQRLHARVITAGLGGNLYLSSLLISKYFSFRLPQLARSIFDIHLEKKPTKTLLWNSMIRGYLGLDLTQEGLGIYREMMSLNGGCKPDRYTFHLALKACVKLEEFEFGLCIGREAREIGLESDLLVATPLMGLYMKAGEIEAARELFDKMPRRDVVSWNSIISGYSNNGYLSECLNLYKEMKFCFNISPTEATFVGLISCFGNLIEIKYGEMMHGHIIKIGFESNLIVSNSLVEMYIKCDKLYKGVKLFNGLLVKDAISYSSLIGGYIKNGRPDFALQLFYLMVLKLGFKPTRPVLLNVILACAYLNDLIQGKWIEKNYIFCNYNEFGTDRNLITAIIYMYAKCKQVGTSLQILNKFENLKEDVIAWNAIMKACDEIGEISTIFEIYFEMRKRGINPDSVTFLLLLSNISAIPNLKKGTKLHAQIVKLGSETKIRIMNSLINMYVKCGKIEDSIKIFNLIAQKDEISWSSIIQAYALNGDILNSFNLFEKMIKTKIRPNEFTFLALLSACRNTGNVEKAKDLFVSMREKYGLEPKIEHFTCVIETLIRAGNFADASGILKQGVEKYGNNPKIWGIFLNNSRFSGDIEIGELAANKLLKLEPKNAANYKMLGETYVLSGRRNDANYIFELLENMELEKKRGISWLECG
ncbi:hypothetical protein LUZ60_008468 [Juncus effusus]|nr:hypothetical protein LUZ60_008468 [Juncus effusus]